MFYYFTLDKRIKKKETNIIFIFAYLAYVISGVIAKMINYNNELAQKIGFNNCFYPSFIDGN